MTAEPHARDVAGPIVITGQGHWSAELAEGLARYSGLKVGLVAFDRPSAAFDPRGWFKLLGARLILVVGFRPGARTRSGIWFDRAFSLVRRLGPAKRVVRYWIGSDVQRTIADRRMGRLDEPRFADAIDAASHFAGSVGLADELREVGVDAEIVDFPSMAVPTDVAPLPMPPEFSVLSYVPDARFEFYGGPQIIAAARALPAVNFEIVGGSGEWAADAPDNVAFLGWQSDMRPAYAAASCVVRSVEFDAVGGTVIEGLAYGRTVVYSRPFPYTILVPFGDASRLAEVLGGLAAEYTAAAKPDAEASAFARRTFDPARLFAHLSTRLLALLSEQAGATEECG